LAVARQPRRAARMFFLFAIAENLTHFAGMIAPSI
jgi:hypothetical protein